MAFWQYKLYLVPTEEIVSYFAKDDFVRSEDFDHIKWWKYRQLCIDDFSFFETIVAKSKSWSDDIVLFGSETTNCIEIITERKKIVEVSSRIDLRSDYNFFLEQLCAFAQIHKCMLLGNDFKIFEPAHVELIKGEIANSKFFKFDPF